METAAGKLVDFWRAQGLSLPAGCDQQAIREFERTHAVSLPDDMRAYLLRANGMLQTSTDAWDEHGFAFYPLAAIGSVATIGGQHESPPARFRGDHDFFVFADYLQISWSYAIRLRGH